MASVEFIMHRSKIFKILSSLGRMVCGEEWEGSWVIST